MNATGFSGGARPETFCAGRVIANALGAMETTLPSTPTELWAFLTGIFPGFAEHCRRDDVSDEGNERRVSFHSVMIPFTEYFGAASSSSTERQLSTLAAFINRAVEYGIT